ncbi:MAG: YgjV family protein [Pseudomonadota bacterium]
MDDLNLIAQAVGILASLTVISAFSQKLDKNFKLILIAGGIFFSLHYILMAAYVAALVAFVNSVRTYFSMKYHKSNKLMIGFICFYIACLFLVYEKPYDVLPVLAGILTCFSLYKLEGIKMRIAMFFSEGSWLIFSLLIFSIGGIITNIFVLITNSITTYRLVKESKNET